MKLSRKRDLSGKLWTAYGIFAGILLTVSCAKKAEGPLVNAKDVKWDYEADVVVIGAGGSGLPAGLKAKVDGASVIVVEANYDCGGHAAVSEGQLHAGGATSSQRAAGIEDSADLYYYDHTRSGLDSRFNSPEYVRSVANSMRECYEWILSEGIIVQDIEPMIRGYYRDGGYDADGVARMTYVDATKWVNDITGTKNNGIGVTRPLEESLRKKGGKFLMNYHMDTIFREPKGGKVLGIQASYTPHIMPGQSEPLKSFMSEGNIDCTKKTVNVRAKKGVIVCTGGSIGNLNFRTMFDPRLGPEFDGLAGMPFSDQDASGELAAMKIGAAMGSLAGYMVDMGAAIGPVSRMGCQYGYGNGFNEKSKVWALFRKRGVAPDYTSLVLVNMLGQRCGNEDLCKLRRFPQSYEFLNTYLNSVFIDRDGDGNAETMTGPLWAIFDSEAAVRNDWDMENSVDYENGYAFKADTLEELASKIVNKYYEDVKMDPAILADTIARYNKFVEKGKDEDWGKTSLDYKIEKGPFYALWATPNLHDTLAALRVNKDMQVVDLDGNVIPSLFAAGESSGGMHVHGLGRVITSGFIAGRAAASVDENGMATADTSLKTEFAGDETNYRTKTDKAEYYSQRGGSAGTLTYSEKVEELKRIGNAPKTASGKPVVKAASPSAGNTYIGTSDNGIGGAIQVQITTMTGKMTDIRILKQNETHGIGDVALPKLVADAMKKQSADIDIIAGATITSTAFKEALVKARAKGGLN